jgi:hypothetical protein
MVRAYTDFVRSRPGILFVEVKSGFIDDCGGTADAMIFEPKERRVEVWDFKSGRGMEVEAEGNYQLAIYALGALRLLEPFAPFDRIVLGIVQPAFGAPKMWELTADQLAAVGAQIQGRVEAIKAGDPRACAFNPSPEACRWCRAKPICPGLTQLAHRVVNDDFAPHAWAEKMRVAEAVESWVKAVRSEVTARVLDGHEVEGYKVVMGRRPNRAWATPASRSQVVAILREAGLSDKDIFGEPSPPSPSAAEKLLKKKDEARRIADLEPLWKQGPASPTVAPSSDKRPALDGRDDPKFVQNLFGDLAKE